MYRVLRDSSEKEKKGWVFEKDEFCLGTEQANLYTGDYSIDDYYDKKIFVIERKGCVSEFVHNITSSDWPRFKDELQRMEEFQFPFLVCEFSYDLLEKYPVGSNIPKYLWDKIRVHPNFIIKRLNEMMIAFKTKVLFTNGSGKRVVSDLFKRMKIWQEKKMF